MSRRRNVPITVAEMPGFQKYAPDCMSKTDRQNFIDYIAWNPTAGSIIRGTGGVRKVDWGVGNRGKRSGVRVIYYYYNDSAPIFLFTVYSKANKKSLSDAEKKQINKAIKNLKSKF